VFIHGRTIHGEAIDLASEYGLMLQGPAARRSADWRGLFPWASFPTR
jgi:hypothetical protein